MNRQQLKEAMAPLCREPVFAEWVRSVWGNRERTLAEFESYQTVADKRITATTIAEAGVFDDILNIYGEDNPTWREEMMKPNTLGVDDGARHRDAMQMLVADSRFRELVDRFDDAAEATIGTLRKAKTDAAVLDAIGRRNAYRALLSTSRDSAHQLVEDEKPAE